MVNLRELKLKGSKVCECGHEFCANDISSLVKNNDHLFYGGRVEFYSEAVCPDCNKAVVILLEAYANSYRVIDFADNEVLEEIQEDVSGNDELQEDNRRYFW